MKRQEYIFVDDGSPEASEDDTNYIGYDSEVPGSYEQALDEVNRRSSIPTAPGGSGSCSAMPSAERAPRENGFPSADGRKGRSVSGSKRRMTDVLLRISSRAWRRIARIERRCCCMAMLNALPLRKEFRDRGEPSYQSMREVFTKGKRSATRGMRKESGQMTQVRIAVAGVLVMATVVGMSRAQTTAPQSSTPPPAQKTWADSITFKGDLRYRYESIDDDSKLNADKETYTRQRDRIRARLGAEAKCNDNLKAGIELSTGLSDPISGNQSLGDGFGKKDFKLNMAYFDYNFFGDDPNEVQAIAGKMKNPFIAMPDDLVWDGDLTPEGLAVKSQLGGGFATLLANGGYMWAQERSDKDDLMLYAGQAAVKLQFVPEIGLTLGASYYGYRDIQGYDVIDWESKNNSYGNSTVNGTVSGSTTNKAWASEFTPVVYFAQLDLWVAGKPLAIYGQELSNGDANNNNEGQLYGVTLGKAKNPKTWEVGYSHAELEKDATVGMFTDSDRWGGGTDGRGHKVYGKYQIMKNLQGAVSYFIDQKTISDPAKEKDYNRLQLDLVASF